LRKSIAFLFINFFITWVPWGLVILLTEGDLSEEQPTFILYILGGLLGPVVSAFVVQRFFGPKVENLLFLRELIKGRVRFWWYVTIFLLPLGFSLVSQLVEGILTDNFTLQFGNEPYYMILAILPTMIIAGGLEEVGWRGVLLPELMKKYRLSIATVIVSIFWVIWHLPLWFMPGTVQSSLNFGYFALSTFSMSILLTVVYVGTRSVFLCILLHALFNTNLMYFSNVNIESAWNEPISIAVKLTLALLLYFTLIHKYKNVALPTNQSKTA
jgi:uncharacterized protein